MSVAFALRHKSTIFCYVLLETYFKFFFDKLSDSGNTLFIVKL